MRYENAALNATRANARCSRLTSFGIKMPMRLSHAGGNVSGIFDFEFETY